MNRTKVREEKSLFGELGQIWKIGNDLENSIFDVTSNGANKLKRASRRR